MTDPNLIEIARLDTLVHELRETTRAQAVLLLEANLARIELADIAEEAFKLAKPKADVKYGTVIGGCVLDRIQSLRG